MSIKYVKAVTKHMAPKKNILGTGSSLEQLKEFAPGLSDNELKMMMNGGAAKSSKDALKADAEDGHDSFEVMNLKNEIEALKNEINRLKKENTNLRADSNSWEQRFNDTRTELKSTEDAFNDVTKKYNQAVLKIDGLEKELASRPKSPSKFEENNEISSLHKQLSEANAKIDRLILENRDLTNKTQNQESSIVSLRAEIEVLRERSATGPVNDGSEPKEERVGKVTLASAVRFESELFEYDMYRVTIDRTGERITFRPDIEGKCPCVNSAIEIPMLPKYVKFEKPASYCAFSNDGKTIFIKL